MEAVIGVIAVLLIPTCIWLFSRMNPIIEIRECLLCGYTGKMKTFFDYAIPVIAAVVLLACYILPGLLFIFFFWNKHKCPNCGALGKSRPIAASQKNANKDKKCPYCAETIKHEAIVCRYCSRDLSASQLQN